MTLAPVILIIAKNIIPFLEDGHPCIVESYILFSMLILVNIPYFTFIITRIQCLGDHKIVEKLI